MPIVINIPKNVNSNKYREEFRNRQRQQMENSAVSDNTAQVAAPAVNKAKQIETKVAIKKGRQEKANQIRQKHKAKKTQQLAQGVYSSLPTAVDQAIANNASDEELIKAAELEESIANAPQAQMSQQRQMNPYEQKQAEALNKYFEDNYGDMLIKARAVTGNSKDAEKLAGNIRNWGQINNSFRNQAGLYTAGAALGALFPEVTAASLLGENVFNFGTGVATDWEYPTWYDYGTKKLGMSPFWAGVSNLGMWAGGAYKQIGNVGTRMAKNIYDRITPEGFRIGNNLYSLSVPAGRLYSGVPLPQLRTNPIKTVGMDLDEILPITQEGYNVASVSMTDAFKKLPQPTQIEVMQRQVSRLDPTVQLTFDGFDDALMQQFGKQSGIFIPTFEKGIGHRIVVPYYLEDGTPVGISHLHPGILENLQDIHDVNRQVAKNTILTSPYDHRSVESMLIDTSNDMPIETVDINNGTSFLTLTRGTRHQPTQVATNATYPGTTKKMILGFDVDYNGNVLNKTGFSVVPGKWSKVNPGGRQAVVINNADTYFVPRNEYAGKVVVTPELKRSLDELSLLMTETGNADNIVLQRPWTIHDRVARDILRDIGRTIGKKDLGTKTYSNRLNKAIKEYIGTTYQPNAFNITSYEQMLNEVNRLINQGYKIYFQGQQFPLLNIKGYKVGGRLKRRFK